MDVTFTDVVVEHPASKRVLLDHVSGRLVPGRIAALMGPSGSGKTTLLTTLGRRFDAALAYRGTVRYNGARWTVQDKRRVAFVPQDDVYPMGLTVREHLDLSSQLRLAELSPDARRARVDEVVRKLRLEKCAGTIMGDAGGIRGVSGGERKRACIANELLTQPLLVLCDEVTSGLDSALSAVVVDTLVDLARSGLTVVSTIHQPGSALFARFDDLLVIDAGRVFYRGERDRLVDFLGSELGRTCPVGFNPADFIIDILVLDDARAEDPRVRRAMEGFARYAPTAHGPALVAKSTSIIFDANALQQQQQQQTANPASPTSSSTTTTEFAAPFHTQVLVLLRRMFRRVGPEIITMQSVLSNFGLVFVASILWWQLDWGIETVFLRASGTFWIVGTDSYLSLFATALALHDETALLKKDLFDASYSLGAYYIAKALVSVPTTSFWSLFFGIIMLACSNIAPTAAMAAAVVATMQLCVLVFQALGLALSASLPMHHVMTAGIVYVTFCFAFAGFFVLPSNMKPAFAWLRWLDPQTYLWQLQMQNVFQLQTLSTCSPQTAKTSPFCGGSPNASLTGAQVLAYFEVGIAPWVCVVVIVLATLGVHVCAFACFWARARRWRGATLFKTAADRMPDARPRVVAAGGSSPNGDGDGNGNGNGSADKNGAAASSSHAGEVVAV